MKKLIIILTLLSLTGCAGLPSKCDTIPTGDSILCDGAKKIDPDLRIEDIGNAFIFINAISIGEGLYTRQEAIDVCTELRNILDDPVTYIQFHDKLEKLVNKYPGLLQVATSYLDLFNINADIYSIDRQMLIDWLDARIKSLGG